MKGNLIYFDNIYSFFVFDKWRPNSSFLGNPNKLGGYLILILPFFLVYINITPTYKGTVYRKLTTKFMQYVQLSFNDIYTSMGIAIN